MKELLKRSIKNLIKFLIKTTKAFIGIFTKQTTVWMIGDSTMCYYDASFAPLAGWGMPFANYFNANVIIKNKAKSGYSTSTFIHQFYWLPIAKQLKKDDVVLIQFGHNDENIHEPSIYNSPENYASNLLQFINETTAKKAFPILITPVARRAFDDYGQPRDTHYSYSNAVRKLAKEHHITMIDLDKLSRNLLQEMGEISSKMLFNYLLPNENPHYPKGLADDTHFNEFGARKIAQLVLVDIKTQQLVLADKIDGAVL